MATVAVVKTRPDDDALAAAVRRSVALLGGMERIVPAGGRVLIKPNIVAPLPRGVTSFAILRAVIEMVREAGADPFLGDCAGMEFDSDKTFALLGFDAFAREMGVNLVNFDRDEVVHLPVRLGPVRRFALPRSAVEADAVINLPRLKRHNLCRVTLGVKNLMGVACKETRRRIHVFGLHKGVALLSTLIRSNLTLIDGTTICERPVFGLERPLGILLASRDVLAADRVACRFLDVDGRLVRHLAWAERLGVGDATFELAGDADEVPPEEGRGGRLGLARRLHRGAFWLTFAAELLYNGITGRTLLPFANVTFGSHPVIDPKRCDRCGRCAEACPVGAIEMERLRINYRLCQEVRCMRCYEACPKKAIRIKGVQKVTLDRAEDEG